jgi:hypothetical protein
MDGIIGVLDTMVLLAWKDGVLTVSGTSVGDTGNYTSAQNVTSLAHLARTLVMLKSQKY